jgi:arylsulfatase A-like enzyme
VHTPYAPPPRYRTLFAGDGSDGPAQPEIRALRDAYDREIRYVDDELRGLFAALAERGLDESTLVVVTADHGEEFLEHGLLQHGAALYEESLRVPLLLWGPGRIPAGVRIPDAVSLIDVMPTLLGLVGLRGDDPLDGVDLGPLLRGDGVLAPRTLVAEARAPLRYLGPRSLESWTPPLVTLRDPHQKFVVHRPPHGAADEILAFDLARDPGERSPRAVRGDEARRVLQRVDRYLGGRGGTGPDPGAAEAPEQLDPALREQLRALGYLP